MWRSIFRTHGKEVIHTIRWDQKSHHSPHWWAWPFHMETLGFKCSSIWQLFGFWCGLQRGVPALASREAWLVGGFFSGMVEFITPYRENLAIQWKKNYCATVQSAHMLIWTQPSRGNLALLAAYSKNKNKNPDVKSVSRQTRRITLIRRFCFCIYST